MRAAHGRAGAEGSTPTPTPPAACRVCATAAFCELSVFWDRPYLSFGTVLICRFLRSASEFFWFVVSPCTLHLLSAITIQCNTILCTAHTAQRRGCPRLTASRVPPTAIYPPARQGSKV